jgi:hypothetical protein
MFLQTADHEDFVWQATLAREKFERFIIDTITQHEREFWIEDKNLLIAIILEAYDEHEHRDLRQMRRDFDLPYEPIAGTWQHLQPSQDAKQ